MRRCPTCDGSQTVECIGADGDYEIVCPTCNGTGDVSDARLQAKARDFTAAVRSERAAMWTSLAGDVPW